MATPTYRSINLTATLLGIDRRLCIVILIVTFLVFLHFTFLFGLSCLRPVMERSLQADKTRSRIGRDRSESSPATERIRPRKNNQRAQKAVSSPFCAVNQEERRPFLMMFSRRSSSPLQDAGSCAKQIGLIAIHR
jgi:hypothetical protein